MNTKISSEAETNEQDLRLEQTLDGQLIEVRDTKAKRETQRVTSYLETWAGNFGTCHDRKQGRRELHFDESLSDMSEQISYCLEALPVLAETMTAEAWRGGIADGFCIITTLISEAANKTIQALDQERKLTARENRKLREDLEQAQGQETDVADTQIHNVTT